MPLNKLALEQKINSIFKEFRGPISIPSLSSNPPPTPEQRSDFEESVKSIREFIKESDEKIAILASELANAIDTYIKQATVTTPIQTNVVGTSPSGPVAGTGTGVGTGTIS